MFAEEIPNVDVQVNITSDFDHYDNFYATKKQRFELDYKDTFSVPVGSNISIKIDEKNESLLNCVSQI